MTRPLRFCMVTTFYPPYNFGGDGIYVRRLSNALAARGQRVEVIHCTDSYRVLARRAPQATGEDHPNITVHRLRSQAGFLSPLASQQTGRPLFKSTAIQKVLEQDFDVIHYHNISLLGPKVLEYGRAIKLYTMHEYWLVCPTHTMFKFNRDACVERSCFACTLVHLRPPQWWRYGGLLDGAVRHVDAFIAPSRFGKQVHERMNLDRPIVHLPNFVPDAPDGEPSEVESQESKSEHGPFFLFVGRLEKLKGLQTLIPVFRRYAGAKLVVAGTGGYESQLRQLAAGSDRILFLGQQNERQLRTLYKQAVALIMPSICFEMFPLVILEAFQQRTPVIARDLGGAAEAVKESGGGLAYESQEELTGALDRLANDPAYRDELGRLGHEAYLRKWTVEAHLERYLALIHDLEARKARGAEGEKQRAEAGSTHWAATSRDGD